MRSPLAAFLAACLPAAACASGLPDLGSFKGSLQNVDVPTVEGQPVSAPAASSDDALRPGAQSTLDPQEAAAILREAGVTGRDGLTDAARIQKWLVENFASTQGGGGRIALTTAHGLLQSRELTGCHDWGLMKSTLLRYAGYPARMVDAAGAQWMELTRAGRQPSVYSGHIFVEAYLDGRWTLLDSVSARYIENYDRNNPYIPMKVGEQSSYVVMYKGVDPAGYGIHGNSDLTRSMLGIASKVDPSRLSAPGETVADLPDVGPATPYLTDDALTAPCSLDRSRRGVVLQFPKAGLDVQAEKAGGLYWAHLFTYRHVFHEPAGDRSFPSLDELRAFLRSLQAGG